MSLTNIPIEVPEEPFLQRIYLLWESSPASTIIQDRKDQDDDFTVEQLLYDILTLQKEVHRSLSDEVRARLNDPSENVFVAILAPAGYRFCVIVLAIYCLGAVAVPLSPSIHPEEAKYFLDLVNATMLVTVPATRNLSGAISNLRSITSLEFNGIRRDFTIKPKFVMASKTDMINPEKGFVMLHTSGTTGPPKGVLHTRQGATTAFESYIKLLELTTDDLWIHSSPMHWMGGFAFTFCCILSGARSEFCNISNGVDQAERLAQGDATCVILPPYRLIQVADIYDERRKKGQSESLAIGLKKLRLVLTGTTDISPSIRARWEQMRDGKPLLVLYTATEILGPVGITDWKPDGGIFPSNSCGQIHPSASVKFSDTGEIYAKSPAMFQKYMSHNPNATKDVTDGDGFYKTGDIGKLENNMLYVLGRASHDVILVQHWKVYAPEIEAALSLHPLLCQAIVLGLPDPSHGYCVAAVLIRNQMNFKDHETTPDLLKNEAEETLSLSSIRRWLAVEQGIAAFKLPTILRLVESDYTIPRTASLKPMKAEIRKLLLHEMETGCQDIEVCEFRSSDAGFGQRAFDWEGYQP